MALSDNYFFFECESIKVPRKKDFEKINILIKSLKSKRSELKSQLRNNNILLDRKRGHIEHLEFLLNDKSKCSMNLILRLFK